MTINYIYCESTIQKRNPIIFLIRISKNINGQIIQNSIIILITTFYKNKLVKKMRPQQINLQPLSPTQTPLNSQQPASQSSGIKARNKKNTQKSKKKYKKIITTTTTTTKRHVQRQLRLIVDNISSFQHVVGHARNVIRKSMVDIQYDQEQQQLNKQKLKKKIKKNKIKKHRVQNSIAKTVNKQQSIVQNNQIDNTIHQYNFGLFGAKGLSIQRNIIKSSLGHSALIFNYPIISGNYYLEFKILEPHQDSQYQRPSHIRVGICSDEHKLDTPLGFKTSIGLNLLKKQIITHSKKQALSQTYVDLSIQQFKQGDTIGLGLQFAPPYKKPNPQKYWEGSCLCFYKNGKMLCKYDKIMQMFYCPGISLYNGASVQVRTKQQQMIYKPDKYQAYDKIKFAYNFYF